MNNVKHTTESLMSEHVKVLAPFWVQKHAVTNQYNSQLTQPESESDAKSQLQKKKKKTRKKNICLLASDSLLQKY